MSLVFVVVSNQADSTILASHFRFVQHLKAICEGPQIVASPDRRDQITIIFLIQRQVAGESVVTGFGVVDSETIVGVDDNGTVQVVDKETVGVGDNGTVRVVDKETLGVGDNGTVMQDCCMSDRHCWISVLLVSVRR